MEYEVHINISVNAIPFSGSPYANVVQDSIIKKIKVKSLEELNRLLGKVLQHLPAGEKE